MEEKYTFHYDIKGGWKAIESPAKSSLEDNYHVVVRSMGYHDFPIFSLGDDASFRVELYRPSGEGTAPYPFLLSVSDSSSVWDVFISDFPSAIELLHKLSTIAQASLVHDVYEQTEFTRREESERTEELHQDAHRRQLQSSGEIP